MQTSISRPDKPMRHKFILKANKIRVRSGHGDVEKQLYESVHASLEAVGKRQLQSVGIPAISSGVFGFPVAVACRNIIQAISDFFRDGKFPSVTEVC